MPYFIQLTFDNIKMANFKSECERLASFIEWQHEFITPEELAASGFYYSGFADAVVCAFCQAGVYRWVPGDNAASDHKRFAPYCPFLLGRPVGNIPIRPLTEEAAAAEREAEEEGRDETGRNEPRVLGNAGPEVSPEVEITQTEEIVETSASVKCKICFSSDIETAFLPCMHATACAMCTFEVIYRSDKCPVCRTVLDGYSRIFLS